MGRVRNKWWNCNNNFDSIPIYKKGKGLPIGNMTSQILAIFYMNGLDNYIKENFG